MNIKILAEYKGEEFEVVLGREYDFSDFLDYPQEDTYRGILRQVEVEARTGSGVLGPFYCEDVCRKKWFSYIRPIQKPIKERE